MSGNGRGRLVWSSGDDQDSSGRTHGACGKCGEEPCRCEPDGSRPAESQELRVRREKSGRRGKTVTVAGPLVLVREDAKALLKQLKRTCGGGGTLRLSRTSSGEACFQLEVQGDHADRVVEELGARGYRVKRSGG